MDLWSESTSPNKIMFIIEIRGLTTLFIRKYFISKVFQNKASQTQGKCGIVEIKGQINLFYEELIHKKEISNKKE